MLTLTVAVSDSFVVFNLQVHHHLFSHTTSVNQVDVYVTTGVKKSHWKTYERQ